MNWWMGAAQYATEALALILIWRLFSLRGKREAVYVIFALFLGFQLLASAEYFFFTHWFANTVDYRFVWLLSTIVGWVFSLSLVYSLAKAVLSGLPGVCRFSRMFLNFVFPSAILLALFTARGEYSVTGAARYSDSTEQLVIIGSVV